MTIYVLREEMYNECAWENGACDLKGVYDSKEKALQALKFYLQNELDSNEELVTEYGRNVDECIEDIRINDDFDFGSYVDVYENKQKLDNGCNCSRFVIEYSVLNKGGLVNE